MGELLVSDWVARFLDWCKPRRKPATVSLYGHYLGRFTNYFKDRNISEVSLVDVETWSAKRPPERKRSLQPGPQDEKGAPPG